MRRSIFSLTLFALLALQPVVGHSQAQSPEPGAAPDRQVGSGAAPCLRLRTGASLDGPILECLDPGTRLRVLGSISGWSRVQLRDGTEGWVDSGYLETAPTAPGPRRQAAPPSAARPADDLRGQIEALEGQLQAMSALRAATEERLRKTVAAAEQAQVEAGRLGQRVRELERERQASGSNRAQQLETELTAAQERIAELEQALAAAESQLLRAAGLNAEQERRIEALDAELATGRAGEAALRQALEAAEERSRAAVPSDAARASQIAELEAEPVPEPAPAQAPPPAPVQVRAPIVTAPPPPAVSVRRPVAVEVAEAEAAAQPAPAAAAPAEAPVPATDAAIDTVHAWAAAWSDQRVDDYLSFYAAGFRPPDGLSRDAWEAQRFERLSRPSYIRVTISALGADRAADGTVRASFRQDYASDSFADTVTKVLTLAEEDGSWRILAEQASP